jgi:DNA polymerase III subunit beta
VKAEVDRKEFADALKRVLPAATGRTSLPVLRGVRMVAGEGAIRFTCSDLSLTISADAPATLKNVGKKEVVVSAELLGRIVPSLPGDEVDVASTDGELHITSGDTEVTLPTFDEKAWPNQLENDGPGVDLNALQLEQIARVLPFAASGKAAETNAVLASAHFTGPRVEITDLYRCAVLTLDGVDLEPTIIPVAALAAVLRTDDAGATIVVGERTVSFRSEAATVTTATTVGEFPDIARLMKASGDTKTSLTFSCNALREALARVAMIDRHVALTPTGDFAHLAAHHTDVGSIEEVVAITGDHDQPVSFACAYMIDMIDAHGLDEITIRFSKPGQPFTVSRPGFDGLLMPIRA